MKLLHGDCLSLLPTLEEESVNLCFVDPPYNIGIFKRMKPDEYLEWCEEWIRECSRVLTANGAFWISHSKPLILAKLSEMVRKEGRELINWITWDKYNGATTDKGFMDGFTLTGTVRSFQPMTEYLIWHADEGNWSRQCDKERGFIFEPLRAYLATEWEHAGMTAKDANLATESFMSGHYLTRSQWALPTKEKYHQLRSYANRNNGNNYLRREYEHLRYTFNNPGKMSSVWQIPPAPKNGHPTPKPPELLRRIILATSNEGDVVLDPMMGGGTTAEVCAGTGREFIGMDIKEGYVEMTRKRVDKMRQLELVWK